MNITLATIIKIIIIIFFLILNIILIIIDEDDHNDVTVLESSTLNKVGKMVANVLIGTSSIYGAYSAFTSKNDIDKLLVLVNKIEKFKNENDLDNIEDQDHINFIQTTNTLINDISLSTEKLLKFYVINPTTNIDEDEKHLTSLAVLAEQLDTLSLANKSFVDKYPQYKDCIETLQSTKPEINLEDCDELNKSFIFMGLLDKYESLGVVGKLSVSLLFLNSALFSAATSLVFIFYGDYLPNKYNLEVRFPKVAHIIKLRRQYQRYYLLFSFGVISTVVLVESLFSIAILSSSI